ncbi:uncharacterized protein EV420DRAFT_1554362 [Desarmillaria tabescens]|uniref:Uncharacterized protein n=1 Tax=Armillaria tabescens TaxID=1929756 RepID=A0AA39K8U9_ARMTA|nr:uncharacterized protein EV420DRAFT_1554362 [Desarmillaria tabescens]KAK0455565.1 hypothetical protein EV420DRAFT_1554362 [Desarmillaria tabescens]
MGRTPGISTVRTLREAERTAVDNSADEMDVQALAWLINVSSNPSVENIVIQSMSALPLKSVDSFKCCIDHTNVPLACTQALEPLLREPDVSVHESKVDRLIRAKLRFTSSPDILGVPQPAKDCFSPTLYAELLCIHPNSREEIRELVISNLKAVDNDPTALHLQPIVWAHLLQQVSYYVPDNLEVMQMLFTVIPSFYWKAHYVPITYALETFGMKISYGSGDGEVTLRMAIQRSLYIYVAEEILHRHMRSEPIIFRQNDSDVLSYQYSRLRLLLSMAGSRSMRSMPVSPFTSNQSLFIKIVRGIGDFLGIASPDKATAAVPLDDIDNRSTVLISLYTLISSFEFDRPLTPYEQTFALTMFFRVLNSTFPHPSILEKNWCMPQLATKSVRIALKDFRNPTHELGTYFFQHTSFTNEALASFVSSLFEQLRTEIANSALRTFLRLIITGLGSEDLGVHIRQKSLEYLHEPDNLFTSCTALIRWDDTKTLRRLALLHPAAAAWLGCLQRLEDSGIEESLVIDFKAFIQAGRVGAFGEDDTASSSSVGSSQGESDNSLQHPWSTVWHRVQRFLAGKPSREIESSSNDNRV